MRKGDVAMSFHEVTIPRHVHGYPEVAFGGYVAGLLSGRVCDPTVRVDFRRAIGVETAVCVAESGERWQMTDGAGLILAEAAPSTMRLDVPAAPSWGRAQEATERAVASDWNRTDCFGCGLLCEPGRGLRLFPDAVRERDMVAAAWVPDARLADENGELPREVVWSAMDCPGGIAAITFAGMPFGAVTARLTAARRQPVFADTRYVCYAWPISRDGRKHTVGVALSTESGEPCMLAEALWIERRAD